MERGLKKGCKVTMNLFLISRLQRQKFKDQKLFNLSDTKYQGKKKKRQGGKSCVVEKM